MNWCSIQNLLHGTSFYIFRIFGAKVDYNSPWLCSDTLLFFQNWSLTLAAAFLLHLNLPSVFLFLAVLFFCYKTEDRAVFFNLAHISWHVLSPLGSSCSPSISLWVCVCVCVGWRREEVQTGEVAFPSRYGGSAVERKTLLTNGNFTCCFPYRGGRPLFFFPLHASVVLLVLCSSPEEALPVNEKECFFLGWKGEQPVKYIVQSCCVSCCKVEEHVLSSFTGSYISTFTVDMKSLAFATFHMFYSLVLFKTAVILLQKLALEWTWVFFFSRRVSPPSYLSIPTSLIFLSLSLLCTLEKEELRTKGKRTRQWCFNVHPVQAVPRKLTQLTLPSPWKHCEPIRTLLPASYGLHSCYFETMCLL